MGSSGHPRRDGTHLQGPEAPRPSYPDTHPKRVAPPPPGGLQQEVAEQREACLKAQAALAAAKAQAQAETKAGVKAGVKAWTSAEAKPQPVEAALRHERREWAAQTLRWTQVRAAHSAGTAGQAAPAATPQTPHGSSSSTGATAPQRRPCSSDSAAPQHAIARHSPQPES